jgi:hypothetical protein
MAALALEGAARGLQLPQSLEAQLLIAAQRREPKPLHRVFSLTPQPLLVGALGPDVDHPAHRAPPSLQPHSAGGVEQGGDDAFLQEDPCAVLASDRLVPHLWEASVLHKPLGSLDRRLLKFIESPLADAVNGDGVSMVG